MNEITKKTVFSLIGILIMLAGFVLPPAGPITKIGMEVLFIFIGVMFLWCTVNGPWTSLSAIVLLGFTGYCGDQGIASSIPSCIGTDTVWMVILMMVLFGGLASSGAMEYVVQWMLTRKAVEGKPYVILAVLTVAAYLLAFVANQMISIIIMWAAAVAVCNIAGMKHGEDKFWIYIFGGLFLGAGIGQPALVYKGIGLTLIRVFTNVSQGITIAPLTYILYNIIMSALLIIVYILLVRFVFRPNTDKMKAITAEKIRQEHPLAPITKAQKIWIIMIPIYLLMLALPPFLPKTWMPVKILNMLGTTGVAAFWLILFSILHIDGKPMMNIQKSAGEVKWNVVFMVGVGLVLGTALGDAELGIITALKGILTPILAGKPTLLIVFLIYLFALIVTNFAVNVAMAIAMMPVIVACSTGLGLNPAPIALGVMMICFIAMMTPAASPLASVCFGEEKYYTPAEIQSYAIPLSIIAVFLFTFIGYPLACIMIG